MSFNESYDFFPIGLIFVDTWLDCISEFWVHHFQEFLEFDVIWNLTL